MRIRLVALLFAGSVMWAQTATWQDLVAAKKWAQAEPLLVAADAATPDSVPVLEALAQTYRGLGRLRQADQILNRLVPLAPTVANVESAARVKSGLGQWERAEQLFERVLELRLDTDSTPVAAIPTRRQLAQVLVAEKKFGRAAQEALIAISVRSRLLGNDAPDLAGDYALLGRVYQAQEAWQEAARAWEEVVRVQTLAIGAEDLRVADSLLLLGECYGQYRRIPEGEAALLKALAIRQVNLGAGHPDVGEATDALGKLLYSAARYADAEVYFERSLEVYTSYLGAENALLARNYDNLAVAEAASEKWDESAEHYREALKIRDADAAVNLHQLGMVEIARKDLAASEPFYVRAVELLEFPGNENPDLLKTMRTELEGIQQETKKPQISKQAPRAKRPPVAAKQK